MNKGLLITFEGLDACGKSTQIDLLKKYFKNEIDKNEIIFVKEPGGTKLGENIRALVQNYEDDPPRPITELLLMLSSRAQLCEKIIIPALKQGKIVIADRFIDSTIAYQGFAREVLNIKEIRHLNSIATNNLCPNITFYLKINPENSYTRKIACSNLDRFEKEPIDFFKKVYEGYEYLAKVEKKRFFVIDANDTITNIHNKIVKTILNLKK